MTVVRSRGDETWNRLLNWSEAQKASERLAGHILAAEGFTSIDPSHPLGGPDGLKDIVCKKDGLRWVAACYFPNGKKLFNDIYQKFKGDSKILKVEKVDGFVFITNQYLLLSQRKKLEQSIKSKHVEIFHLERLTHILDRPENYGVRRKFLDIGMDENEEEKVSYVITKIKQYIAEAKQPQQGIDEFLKKMQDLLSESGDKK